MEGVYCLVVFQTYFNPNNSLLIILQISLLFGFTPALTDPESDFEIKVSRRAGCVLTSNKVHFVSLANNFTVQFSNLLKLPSGMENKQLNGPGNYRELRETGPGSEERRLFSQAITYCISKSFERPPRSPSHHFTSKSKQWTTAGRCDILALFVGQCTLVKSDAEHCG